MAKDFAPVFAAHPGIGDMYVADLVLERAERVVNECGFAGAVSTVQALIELEVDAIAIFTPRDTHAQIAIEALRQGVHVYSAVPAATSLDDLRALVDAVEAHRCVYMTGETSYYYPEAVYCRNQFGSGRWGRFVHADAQYVHDMATWGPHFELTYGKQWRAHAAIPPLLYATHSFSLPLSITDAHVTGISALGWVDPFADSGYGPGNNPWNNPFSNEVALARTSDGGMIRVGEFRRIGWFAQRNGREVMMPAFYCTDVCFEENSGSTILIARRGHEGHKDWSHDDGWQRDIDPWVACQFYAEPEPHSDAYPGMAHAHHTERLPREYQHVRNGHNGSHQFLVDDFVRACQTRTVPPCNVWRSAAWTAPGLVGHQSAIRSGEWLDVPHFGDRPNDWPELDLPIRQGHPGEPQPPELMR